MKATIYDIAQQAGVSTATVSKVINGSGRISAVTRMNVLRIMEELNYQPSVVASALTGKQTFTLGLLLPDLANPFFAEIARNIEDRAHEKGFSVMICSTDNMMERTERNITFFKQKRVDGILIATGAVDAGTLDRLLKSIPIVLLAREIPMMEVDTIRVDDYLGGSIAVKHLLANGHRHIGVIAEDTALVTSSMERIRGYQSALQQQSIPYHPEWIVQVKDFNPQTAKEAAGRLIDAYPEITAVFACNDLLATAVIQAAHERNLTVPGDLSIVGFDNTQLATIVHPPLTTVAQPIQEMARFAVDVIVNKINDRYSVKQQVVMLPELVTRSSVSAPKRG